MKMILFLLIDLMNFMDFSGKDLNLISLIKLPAIENQCNKDKNMYRCSEIHG